MHRMAQGVAARVFVKNMFIHMSPRVWSFAVSLRFDFFLSLSLECLYIFSDFFISSILFIIFHVVGTAVHENPCAHAEWGVLLRGDTQHSHRLWVQPARQLRLLRDFCNDLTEWIRRHRRWTVVLVRCGTWRWAYRKSAIFTTIHSGARRTSEPETNLSLSWRKCVTSSVLFHPYKYGETRVQTKFRFVLRTVSRIQVAHEELPSRKIEVKRSCKRCTTQCSQ